MIPLVAAFSLATNYLFRVVKSDRREVAREIRARKTSRRITLPLFPFSLVPRVTDFYSIGVKIFSEVYGFSILSV